MVGAGVAVLGALAAFRLLPGRGVSESGTVEADDTVVTADAGTLLPAAD
jgi:hypothetical protein